jgi:hypothetical protein
LLGVLAFAGAQFMSYELTAELLNFGAFLGFMGVNAAVLWKLWVRSEDRRARHFLRDLIAPVFGFLFCTVIWLGLGSPAKIAGSIWLVIGFFVLAIQTQWFRTPMIMSDPSTYE